MGTFKSGKDLLSSVEKTDNMVALQYVSRTSGQFGGLHEVNSGLVVLF